MNPISKLSSLAACKNVVSLLASGGCKEPQLSRYVSCMPQRMFECHPPSSVKDVRIELSRGLGDVHELKHVLRQAFFLDEPSVKLFKLNGGENCGELIDVMLQGITYEESLIAKCNVTNEMVGFSLNGSFEKFEIDKWVEEMKDPRNKKLLTLWGAVNQQFNMKCIIPAARSMSIFYLGVVPHARKQGLGKKLVNESLVLAKARGYGVVQVFCTSDISTSICASLGMKRACIVDYDSLRMPSDGRPILTKPPPPPNENIKIYYQTT